ncbi:hypothetical protein [Sphaerisporangium sp. NPDC051011]|uniref:hypothetical protein n=1 Tax=Sphaerisporangium sp. NPDC051011 TaxID=3155792 RepID=UPI0033C13616
MTTPIPPGRSQVIVDRPDLTHDYRDYEDALSFYAWRGGYAVWEGDAWLHDLDKKNPLQYRVHLPEHQRLMAAAVEYFPGSDYALHLIPAGQGLPRPQDDQWVIYAPGRASESTVYATERAARRALYAIVAHEVLATIPWWANDDDASLDDEAVSVLVHVVARNSERVVGFGGITSYYTGNRVVFGLIGSEPFAVNLEGQDDDGQAREILAERLGAHR